MKTSGLDQELALRIGVAARALPGGSVGLLMGALVDALGMPLTAAKFDGLTVGRLRAAKQGALAAAPRAALRLAIGYLRGSVPITLVDDELPSLDAYDEGDMPGSVRVAVASEGAERVDGNFSTCRTFLVYQVSAGEIRLIDRRSPPSGGKSARDVQRTALIDDCHLLYAKSLGNPATARLMRGGVHPVRAEGIAARKELAGLQSVLRGNPPPWLARAMGNDDLILPGLARPLLVYSRDGEAERR